MRTTIDLDADVARAARSLARARSISLGEAISELARRGMEHDHCYEAEDGLPAFRVPPDARPITPDDVKSAEDEC